MVRLVEMVLRSGHPVASQSTSCGRNTWSRWRTLRSTTIFFTCLLLVLAYGCGKKGAPASTAPIVSVAKPVTRLVNDHMDFTGNTVAIDSVTLVARVEGFLEKIHFTDGQRVKKGDLLFTMQQSQYQ